MLDLVMTDKKRSVFNKRQKVYCFFKRTIDIFGSIVGIIVLSPVMLVTAIIIKCTSKGPVFFIQERYGKNLKVFKLIKFRSMKIDAPEISPFYFKEGDEKKLVYPFGSFIRKTSIDEIPNLFNVLAGQMSFIGPRPQMAHNEEDLKNIRLSYNPNAFDVRPGISSYSIVKGHRTHDINIKAKLDSEYVKNMSFLLDCKIFFLTIAYVFTKKV